MASRYYKPDRCGFVLGLLIMMDRRTSYDFKLPVSIEATLGAHDRFPEFKWQPGSSWPQVAALMWLPSRMVSNEGWFNLAKQDPAFR